MGKRLIITESEKREILGLYKKNIFEQSVETQAAISKLDPNVFNATVLDIQVKLNKKNVSTPGWVALKEDGKYGTNTKKALSDYLIAKKASPSTTSYTVKTATGNIVMDATQLQDAISKGEIKADTKVWKEGMPNWIAAGTAEDLKSMFAKVAPEEAPEEKSYEVSVDGKAAAIKYTKETLTKAITDGTLNKDLAYVIIVDPTTKAKSYQKVMQNSELAQIFNSLSTPASVTPERKSTNIPELDAWLKGPIGSAWDKVTDPKQKESMFDSFEKTDPTISQLKNTLGKGKVRSALGMAADTGFGRGIQNLRAKAGAAITGNQPVR